MSTPTLNASRLSQYITQMGQIDPFGRVRQPNSTGLAGQRPGVSVSDMDEMVTEGGFVSVREGAYATGSGLGRNIKVPFGLTFDVKDKPANFDDLPRDVRQSMVDVVRIQAGRYTEDVGNNTTLPPTEIEITRDEIKIRTLDSRPIRMVAPQVIMQEREDSTMLYRFRPTQLGMEFASFNRDEVTNPEKRWYETELNDVVPWTQVVVKQGSVNFAFEFNDAPAKAAIKTVVSDNGPALTFVWTDNNGVTRPMDVVMDTEVINREVDVSTLFSSAAYGERNGSGTEEDPFNFMEMLDGQRRYRFIPHPYSDPAAGVFLAILVQEANETTWSAASISLG